MSSPVLPHKEQQLIGGRSVQVTDDFCRHIPLLVEAQNSHSGLLWGDRKRFSVDANVCKGFERVSAKTETLCKYTFKVKTAVVASAASVMAVAVACVGQVGRGVCGAWKRRFTPAARRWQKPPGPG